MTENRESMLKNAALIEAASAADEDGDAMGKASSGEVDMKDVLAKRFSSGQGVVTLVKGMSNGEILAAIREAVDLSNGKAFVVIPPQ